MVPGNIVNLQFPRAFLGSYGVPLIVGHFGVTGIVLTGHSHVVSFSDPCGGLNHRHHLLGAIWEKARMEAVMRGQWSTGSSLPTSLDLSPVLKGAHVGNKGEDAPSHLCGDIQPVPTIGQWWQTGWNSYVYSVGQKVPGTMPGRALRPCPGPRPQFIHLSNGTLKEPNLMLSM